MQRIEKCVYDRVVAVVKDYDRMERVLKRSKASAEQRLLFQRTVSAIDNALIAVCADEAPEAREALRRDIAERAGYERSIAKKYYLSRKIFETRKRECVYMIAVMLGIL